MRKSKHASVSLECALTFPMILLILIIFYTKLALIDLDLRIKTTIMKESEKAALYGILYEYSGCFFESITEKDINESIGDLVFVQVYELLFSRSFQRHYEELHQNHRWTGAYLKQIRFYVQAPLFDTHPTLTAQYTIHTFFGTSKKTFSIPVRTWLRGDESGKLIANHADSVWDMSYLKRGEYLRKRFGGNLPMGFPFLSGFRDHQALLIKSMDLNLKTWQDPGEIQKKLQREIFMLSCYQGNLTPWGKDSIFIQSSDIFERVARFIFPENIDMELLTPVFRRVAQYGEQLGVVVDIIYFHKSALNKENSKSSSDTVFFGESALE